MKDYQRANPAVIPTVSTIATGIILLLMTSIIVFIAYYKKRKVSIENSDAAIVPPGPDSMLILQHNTCYRPFGSQMVQRNSNLLESTHSYVINSLELSHTELDEEQYWQPASKEEELKYQLKKLMVDEILKDNIK